MVTSLSFKDTLAEVYNFEVENAHNYYVGDRGYLVHNECRLLDIESAIRGIDESLIKSHFKGFSDNLMATGASKESRAAFTEAIMDLGDDTKITSFVKDFAGASNDDLLSLVNDLNMVESWRLLLDAGRTGGRNAANGLTRNIEAIKALNSARLNTNVTRLGITADDLVKIQSYKTDAGSASFKDIVTDINKMADNLNSHNIEVENLNPLINKFHRTDKFANKTNKGFHHVIKDLGNDVSTFNGNTVTLEFPITNARGNTSSIDAFCANCDIPNLKIEYKSGPTSISTSSIKDQFIERDLFNASSLDELQWRMDGTGLTKEKLVDWLTENKSSIRNLGYEKIKGFFPLDNTINRVNFADKLISKFQDGSSFYNDIFR